MLYVTSVYLMFALLPVSYGYVLATSLLATVAHVRLFMIGHDCAHRSYLPRKGWQNKALGNFIGVLTNTPLDYWGSQHLVHHQTVGNLRQKGLRRCRDTDDRRIQGYGVLESCLVPDRP